MQQLLAEWLAGRASLKESASSPSQVEGGHSVTDSSSSTEMGPAAGTQFSCAVCSMRCMHSCLPAPWSRM